MKYHYVKQFIHDSLSVLSSFQIIQSITKVRIKHLLTHFCMKLIQSYTLSAPTLCTISPDVNLQEKGLILAILSTTVIHYHV